MKKVVKDFNSPPPVLDYLSIQHHIQAAIQDKNNHEFKTSVYRHPDVLAALSSKQLYNNKCAFCESDTTAGAPMQVEHYRPKAKITDCNSLQGYYWLGYEWSNLLLACSSCNNKKRNHFPLQNNGVRSPGHPVQNGQVNYTLFRVDSPLLLAENPLLINPEVEAQTRHYFSFKANGTVEGNDERANATIKYCGLNRPNLVIKRKELYDSFFNKFMRHFEKKKQGKIIATQLHVLLISTIEDLISHLAVDGIYYEFAWTCWTKFPDFFIHRFQPTEAHLLEDAYQEVLTEVENL